MTNASLITADSPAKLNWLLHVGPTRLDGYHSLHTVYQTLTLSDKLTVSAEPVRNDNLRTCAMSGFPPDIDPDKNLVKLAWEACSDAFPGLVGGVRIHAEKQLPRGGGLGGGSSNAGTVIRAIAQLFNLGDISDPVFAQKLQQIAACIGSDVPFFINGGTAQGTGRGEIIHQMADSKQFWLVLLMPEASVSTAEAYRLLDLHPRATLSPAEWDSRVTSLESALLSGDAAQLAPLIHNDFELFAAQHQWFTDAKAALEQAGALRGFLCGSGSTVAGLCQDESTARRIAAQTGGIATSTRPAADCAHILP